jgi:photosystem II stability/assembly factor-like uncharacterized protein
LLAIAVAGWWLQPYRSDTGRTGLIDRILFPTETNLVTPRGFAVWLSHDGRVARAAAAGGTVRSDNLGAIWYPEIPAASPPFDRPAIMAVAQSADGRRAIAVGRSGILTTVDDGATWVERKPQGAEDLNGIVMSADGMRAIATGRELNRILRTEDGGITWTTQGRSLQSVSLSADGLTVLAISGERLLRSVDGGASWSDVTAQLGDGAQLLQIGMAANARRAIAVIRRPDAILYSTDGGTTWGNRSPWDGESSGRHIALSADGSHAIISGKATSMTTDGGATWTRIAAAGWHSSSATLSADGSKAIILEHVERNIYSSDAGKSWHRAAPWKRTPAFWTVAVGIVAIALLAVSAWRQWRR